MFERHGITTFCHLIATIALMAWSNSAVSQGRFDELGRLFTDVEQRDKLDAIRQGAYDEETESQDTVSAVTVNGIMMRSDGENVVWVNGESTLEGNPAKGVKVYTKSADSHTYSVPVRVEDTHVRIKPGQSWKESSDQIKDGY
ncbi:MAG: hypothetical protein KJO91_13415 [Gammaproteobacteria bacterium]|jgi:hypothetical protein|nr:hypothetical protein [Gammaproteobacteria bacterium]